MTIGVAALLLFGARLVWRGLRGSRAGERGLLRTRTGMLGRIEGFRLVVFGLVLIGVAASIVFQARWLLILALGIGFVEILESSALITFWPRER
jgi:hypothetical protein